MRFQPLLDQSTLIVEGLKVTLIAASGASVLAVVLGVLIGVASQLGQGPLYRATRAFVYFFRGVPLLVLLFLSFYTLPAAGVMAPALLVGIVVFGLNGSGYVAEVVRSGLEAVDQDQREAASLDGANAWTALTRVILPQAAPQMVAPTTNQLVNLVKGTSLLSVISVMDLTRATQLISSGNFIPFEAYLFLGVAYLVMVGCLTRVSTLFERRLTHRTFHSRGPRGTQGASATGIIGAQDAA